MKVTKTAVYRITASMACGCVAQQEFEDADYKKPIGKEAKFTVCKKHEGKAGVDILETVLIERVQEEAEAHVTAPVAPVVPTRPNAAASVDEEGNLIMRVPIKQNAGGRGALVRPSGATATHGAPNAPVTSAVAGRPVPPLPPPGAPAPRPTAQTRPSTTVNNPRQGARTGPVKTYERPMSSQDSAAARVPAPVSGEEEPDLFDQNDPDFMNAR